MRKLAGLMLSSQQRRRDAGEGAPGTDGAEGGRTSGCPGQSGAPGTGGGSSASGAQCGSLLVRRPAMVRA
jgi:hypothetical protein